MKKLLLVLCLVFMFFTCVSCGEDDKVKVGILQFKTIDALDNARIGFIAGLEANGFVEGENITIIVKNPEGDETAISADSVELVRTCDIVLGIATPAAVSLQTAAKAENSDAVILFTAVTDPVAASLLTNVNAPEGNITGTSDSNPVEEQVDLINKLLPNMKKLGIIYTSKEVNSKVQANLVEDECETRNIQTVIQTTSDISEISPVVRQLIVDGEIDALYIPTDNDISENLAAVITVTDEFKIPTIVGEEGMIVNGGTLTYSISYIELGKVTGEMAAKILNGEKVVNIPVGKAKVSELKVVVNNDKLTFLGLELPQSIKDMIK